MLRTSDKSLLPVSSQRLPAELLGLVMDFVEDSSTMRQCSLVGSCLRPYAQRALFTEVRIFVGAEGSHNLDRLLECYTSRPYARHARYLIIKFRRSNASTILSDYPDLQRIITLLSTCQQDIDPNTAPLSPPASAISSIYISGLSGSAQDFVRILCAFPSVTKLKFTPKECWADKLDLFLVSAPSLPRLQHLQVFRADLRRLDSVLFPQGGDVHLRVLSIDCCPTTNFWNTLIHRAGTHLEELSIEEPTAESEYTVFDLSANTRLRSVRVFLDATIDAEGALLEWAIPTLCTLNSEHLFQVTLGFCVVHDEDAVRTALLALDGALCEGNGRHTLQRVECLDWVVFAPGSARALDDNYTQNFLREVFPNCYAQGFLHDAWSSSALQP